jgi:hypothetical protein
MTWNYRVLRHVTANRNKPNVDTNEEFFKSFRGEREEEEYYRIHEVYYEDDGEISSCSENPCLPYGDTVEELQEVIELMKAAFDKPAIPYEDI